MKLETPPIFYITKDPERATGIEDILENYHIICPYKSPLTRQLKESGVRVFVIEEEYPQNLEKALRAGTYGMLQLECVKKYLNEESKGETPRILILKNSKLMELWCEKQGWKLFAPKANTATAYENKISQYNKLKDFVPFPKTIIAKLENAQSLLENAKFPLVMQFNSGHSGEGTIILNDPSQLESYKQKFPDREVRIASFIKGKTYTLNALAAKNGNIYTGSISLQLTGLPEATNNPSSTVGNDFQKPREDLTEEQTASIASIAQIVGMTMRKEGYVGLFGIDVIAEEKTGNVCLIEVNTHQPASVSFEARLHRAIGKIPLFLIWVRDMMEQDGYMPQEELLSPILLPFPAYQILYRNKENREVTAETLNYPGSLNIIPSRMKHIGPNQELFRIQIYEQPITNGHSHGGHESH
ncbi:MAG: ATP-grasp domain-containing protein [Candidatus Wildermuthbacteria bacterium]|nr:ATP-grasp domain-containing protein [Candidatus Wildermuthbacteria bacterium]